MKSVLISIQPYWVFLIIAKKMGWNIDIQKTIEIRKNYPKDENWDKVSKIYCSKDKKSFSKIPKEYQPLMEQFLGKVIGEFVCSNIAKGTAQFGSCLTMQEIAEYANNKEVYGWCISDLVIYDEPRELSEFKKAGFMTEGDWLAYLYPNTHCHYEAWAKKFEIERPPQSWCYVEERSEK
ncbi:MAG: hypothetical protein IKJ80_00470 [Clostridia bacterium]|nr:hypothetical protein [Clostridia bacterium]